jgi:type IV secretory pathway VirB10-like protein
MAEPIINSQSSTPAEPELRQNPHEPMGVLRKNLKPLLYLGVAGLVIAAAVFSSTGKKTPAQQAAAQHEPPQPMVQDNTDNNVQDLKNQLATEKHQSTQAGLTPAQTSAMSAYIPTGQQTPCVPGQTCPQQQNGYVQAAGEQQLSPAQQATQQLAIKERQLAYDSRFASNLVYAHQADAASPVTAASQSASNLVASRTAGDPSSAAAGQTSVKRSAEVNIDSAVGQPYVIYEGTTLDTVLMNRLDGDAVGPIKVLVSNPVYSHDHQHVLIPDGTVVLGEAKKIGSAGFGQQRRMAVAFHRMIMPDGYSVDLDQFHGLDQIGAEGLKDKVNNHYLQIFGASIALGIVSGAAEIEQGGGTITTSGSQAFTTGTASSVSQSATTVLDRFIQIPPTITIREGHRVKVYFTQDMLLPAYENHTISQTF